MPDNSAPPVAADAASQPRSSVGRSCDGRGRASWAIALILFGVALFLSNIGLLPIRNIWTFWPLYLVVIGFSKLLAGGTGERGAGAIIASVGVIFFAENRHWFHLTGRDWTTLAALLLIGFGIFGLLAAVRGEAFFLSGRRTRRRVQFVMDPLKPADSAQRRTDAPAVDEQWLRDSAVFGGIKRRVETNQFMGGNIESVFGSLDLDMRSIALPPLQNTAILRVNCVFGSVKLRLPPHWRVSMQVTGAFGAAEDKTIPSPRADLPTSTLLVTGHSAFGSVEIEN